MTNLLDMITARQCDAALERGEACMECGEPVTADNVEAVLWSRERGPYEHRVIHTKCQPEGSCHG
jgi:predicted transcriptional regulator